MPVTARKIMELVNGFAPFDTAEDYDNVGLLVGKTIQEVDTVLVALDATPGVIAEARALDAQLLLTHHPLPFATRRDLLEADREGVLLAELARARLSLIAAHTNFDRAAGGVNDALIAALSLPAGEGEGFTRTAALPEPLPVRELAQRVEAALGDVVRRFDAGDPAGDRLIRRLTVCGGGGGDFWAAAIDHGAECFLTGECKLHNAMEAVQCGLCVLEAGHAATERPGVRALRDALQTAADAVQYSIRVILSARAPYA
jgi:dinuclear metal center YbgI/SA1388 family protein